MFDYRKLLKNNFTKSVLMITGGTAFAQFLSIVLSPIITRIYPPEQYGVLTVYVSILGMLSIVGSLKYEWGIPIADDEEKAINTLALSIIVLLFIVSLITFAIIIFGTSFLGLFDAKSLIDYKFLIPIGVFMMGLYSIFTQWALRNKNYKSISKTKFSQSISQNIIKIGLGLLKIGPIGLIIGNITGQSAGITTLASPLFRKNRELLKKINFKKIIWSAKRYKEFPMYLAPSQFLNTAGLQLPVLMITSIYGKSTIGLYGLANSIVSIPMNLIGRSIADVFYAEAASIGRTDPEQLKNLSIKLLKKLILVGIVPLITLLIFGPILFSFVFGEAWYQAGVYARILSFLVFTRLIFTPISMVFSVFEKQKQALILDVLRVGFVLFVFFIAYYFSLNSYSAIILYTISMSFIYFLTFVWAQRIINLEIENKY
ncbi:oligosaccharide flippase family protein [Senegalia massiliensis]|uniref:oligosaccharide flippase family protein n=1 Tax=Senegalia massiliensis TaxID=1720316 RepID=UPI001031A09C|nr:oligosaccharide flippase family protein [Senegalia massiliensis]